MARKKQKTFGEMQAELDALMTNMAQEKKRMAEVMASALMDDKAATLLGDFSDTDLRRVMTLLAGHVEQCAAQVRAEKQAKANAARQQATPVTGTDSEI